MEQEINSEVLFFISQLPVSYIKKIPIQYINALKFNCSLKKFYELDHNKVFFKQNICDEAYKIIEDIIIQYFLI